MSREQNWSEIRSQAGICGRSLIHQFTRLGCQAFGITALLHRLQSDDPLMVAKRRVAGGFAREIEARANRAVADHAKQVHAEIAARIGRPCLTNGVGQARLGKQPQGAVIEAVVGNFRPGMLGHVRKQYALLSVDWQGAGYAMPNKRERFAPNDFVAKIRVMKGKPRRRRPQRRYERFNGVPLGENEIPNFLARAVGAEKPVKPPRR